MILHVLPWDSKGNHGSVRKRARAIQCHRVGATCLVASDGSLVGATRTVRGGGWGTAFSTWLLKKGVFPFVIVGITQVAIFFAFFGPKFNYQSWKLGQFFCCLHAVLLETELD